MSASHTQPINRHTVSPSKPAQALQLVQGGYYVLAGLAVALAVVSLQGPADGPRPGSELWLVRVVGVAAAGFGVVLLVSGWRKDRPILSAGWGLWVALALLVQGTGALAMGWLPMTFLIDAAMEVLFVGLWATIMFARIHRDLKRTTPLPS